MTGKKDNLKNLFTFGCWVFVYLPCIRKESFKQDAQQRIFVGYVPHTDHLILWYDEGSSQVKISTQAKFEEGFNNLPVDNLPLNYQQILQMNGTWIKSHPTRMN